MKQKYNNHDLEFIDTKAAPLLYAEIFGDNYDVLKNNASGALPINPSDIILDIGANEGYFSILMSILFPTTRIIALEPVCSTFFTLCQNVKLNHCANIEKYNIGVSKPGIKSLSMIVAKDFSGGSTSFCTFDANSHYKTDVGVISLDEVFSTYHIDRCKLLKMDIEGGEYDALYPSTVLPLIDFMVCEIHYNQKLDFDSRRPDGLVNWLSNRTKLLKYELCKMAE
jgi:FkbM family methyltransferase